GVKAIFADDAVKDTLARRGMFLSSANSINWGRLVPQIAYYVSCYCDLIKNGRIACGEHINVVVPTGNFGNILAAYYAKKCGIPINRLICASNANNVLTEFIKTGIYSRNRPFYTTISPSMDILISSNLERLLFDLSGCDDEKLRGWMTSLAADGRYEVDAPVKERLREHFSAGFCSDDGTRATIKSLYERYNYICDPHTAVALNVYEQYRSLTGDGTKTVVASTASPFKFASDVLEAVKGTPAQGDDFAMVNELAALSMLNAPRQLLQIREKPLRFTENCEVGQMKDFVLQSLA
ncbi:MAG: threonine synthase, partial [Clostridia bacterium]|nr:threonine synthase [Clostridia bacterium]